MRAQSKRALVGTLLLLTAAAIRAQAPPPPVPVPFPMPPGFRAEPPGLADAPPEVRQAVGWLSELFELPHDLQLGSHLLEAGQRLATEHMARLVGVARGWWSETRSVGDPKARRLAMQARMLNELALWHADSLGPDDDTQRLADALRPGQCQTFNSVPDWTERMLRVAMRPADQRGTALAREERLLKRWGQPRGDLGVPASEQHDLVALADRAVAARAGQGGAGRADTTSPPSSSGNAQLRGAALTGPMPPMAALMALSEGTPRPGVGDSSVHRAQRCAVLQWALRAAVEAPDADRAAWFRAWLTALAPRLTDVVQTSGPVMSMRGRPPEAPGRYPEWARHFRAEARIVIELAANDGKAPAAARVVSRRVSVPGLGNAPPLLFYFAFDEASLQQVAQNWEVRRQPEQVEIQWRLP